DTGNEVEGMYVTPAPVARALVEAAVWALGELSQKSTITGFDPACGTGGLLREAVRHLEALDYAGSVRLIGWDISPDSCDVATFLLTAEAKASALNLEVEVTTKNSLLAAHDWPEAIDLLVMNPPFLTQKYASRSDREM